MTDPKRAVAMSRRALLFAAPAIPASGPASGAMPGADWPTQSVRYINPFPPGGATDTLSRIFCAMISGITGQQFMVENRSGSGGNVGVDVVAKATPDGTTIGLGGIASHAISPTLYPSLPFDSARDFTFFSGLWRLPNIVVVNNDLPARSVPEMLALFHANPGKYAYGSSGMGTTPHLSGELLKQLAGVDLLHVPYRGGAPALLDLMAGRIHLIMDNIPGYLPSVRDGKIRALAVTSRQRSAAVPELPSLSEFLPAFDMSSWTCLCGPAGIPDAMAQRVAGFARRALEHPDLVRSYQELGATPWPTTSEYLIGFRAAEEARLAPLVRSTGARIE